MSFWYGKRVMVTGASGTVGKELVAQLLREEPAEIVGIDNNESELFFQVEQYRNEPRVSFTLCDIREFRALQRCMDGIDVVLHAAALKHVVICERSPGSAVLTNIQGVQNVVDVATACGVERVVLTSSDKAVNPTSVMGTSKLMGERLLSAANANRQGDTPIFTSTRFGNVLGSRGSVIPIFEAQIRAGGPITLTDRRMTRFIMTLEEAVSLVMRSAAMALGGEIFVTKMPVVRIEDLARAMIDLLAPVHGMDPADIEVQSIGAKAGEKFYEELISDEEARRTIELDDYYVVTPALRPAAHRTHYTYPGEVSRDIPAPYHSSNCESMSLSEVKDYLLSRGLLSGIEPAHVAGD